MKKTMTIATMAAVIAVPAIALPVLNLKPDSRKLTAKENVRLERAETVKEGILFSGNQEKLPESRLSVYMGDEISEVEKYGELELVCHEDFSKLDKGTIEDPWTNDFLWYGDTDPEYTYPWTNFKPEYTGIPGWGVGGYAWAAGGTLCFQVLENEQVHVNTPMLDLTGKGGNIGVLEFRVRSLEGQVYDGLHVEAAETNHMGPRWDINEYVMLNGIPDQWTTVRFIYQDCGPSFIFNIVGMRPGDLYIDDIKVYKMKPYLGIPKPTYHTLYNGTDFTANWTASPGAEKYLITVYDMEGDGSIRDYIYKDQEVPGDKTSFKVEGVQSGNLYYYTVKAVKGDVQSIESRPLEVADLEAPKMNPVVEKGDYGYHASWNEVPQAEVYDYFAYYKRVAEEDGEFVICDENFDGIRDGDGNLTGWTKENLNTEINQGRSYDRYYPQDIKQKGWYGLHFAPYTDYIAIDGWWYFVNDFDNSGFISPELDLSKDGGKINISMKLAGETVTLYDDDQNEYIYTESCCVALFNWNPEREDYDQVELVYVDYDKDGNLLPEDQRVGEDWKTFNVTLTKGGPRSVIGIYAIGGADNLYIDDLRITQNYKKGEYFLDPFFMGHNLGWHQVDEDHGYCEGGNEIDVEIPLWASGTEVYHNAQAVRGAVNQQQDRVIYSKSEYSDMAFVRSTISGVGTVQLEKGNVDFSNGLVTVDNPGALEVSVMTLDGKNCFRSNETRVVFMLPANGIYIVTVGKESVKIIF